MNYQLSNSFHTLTHWQSGNGQNRSDLDMINVFTWNGKEYYIPGCIGFADTSLFIAGQWEALSKASYTFEGHTAYKHFKDKIGEKNIIVGSFDWGTEKLKTYPIKRRSGVGLSVWYPGEKHTLETNKGDFAMNCAIPTIHRVALFYGWYYDGYESNIPEWAITSESGTYENHYGEHPAYRDDITFSSLNDYLQAAQPMLTEAYMNANTGYFVKPLIPKGCVASYRYPSHGSYPAMYFNGFNNYFPNANTESFPEDSFTWSGSGEYLSAGALPNPEQDGLYDYMETLRYVRVRGTSQQSNAIESGIATHGSLYGTELKYEVFADPIYGGENSQLGGLHAIQYPGYLFKRIMDGETQKGAMAFGLLNIATKFDLEPLIVAEE